MNLGKSYLEQELLQNLVNPRQQNDAIRHIYRAHYSKVEQYILQNGGSEADAEDIFQEALVNFIRILKEGKFRGECSSGTFLYSLSRHAWLNEFKRKNRAKVREEKIAKGMDTLELDAAQNLITVEIKQQLQELLNGLGETCKKILTAFYFEELSMKEILQGLDYANEQVVRNKKSNCLKKLGELLLNRPQTAQNLKTVLLYE